MRRRISAAAFRDQVVHHALCQVPEPDLMAQVGSILTSGEWAQEDAADACYFAGDDLLAACRPRGLPIGNLSSQCWSKVYLHALNQFVTRELGCSA